MTEVSRAEAAVAVIVQARMSSSRLPGKVLMDLGPGSAWSCWRAGSAASRGAHGGDRHLGGRDDDPVAEFAERAGLPVVRGPLEDVLERYRLAAASVVVRGGGEDHLRLPAVRRRR